MKKILLLLLFSVALFLGCSDLSVSDEDVVKNELPADFSRSDYAEINLDVPKSQIVFKIDDKIKENFTSVGDPARISECKKILNPNGEISSLAKDIYSDYLGCPKDGWDENDKCPGIYGQVPFYNKATVKNGDTTWKCVIGGCWSGGGNELINTDCKDLETSIVSPLCNGEDLVLPTTLLNTICRFVLPKAENIQKAEDYLKNFSYDSTLIERHYLLTGRGEGRPYKYCKGDEATGTLRNPDLALKVGNEPKVFYDYGKHSFCLSKTDGLIYLLK